MKLRPRKGHIPSGKERGAGRAPSEARKELRRQTLGFPSSLASSSLK